MLNSTTSSVFNHVQVCAPRHHFGLLRRRLGLHHECECPEHVPDVQGFPAKGGL